MYISKTLEKKEVIDVHHRIAIHLLYYVGTFKLLQEYAVTHSVIPVIVLYVLVISTGSFLISFPITENKIKYTVEL